MTPYDAGLLAQAAYTTAPTIGAADSAARVVISPDGKIWSIPGTNDFACVEADAEFIPRDAGQYGQVFGGIWAAFEPIVQALPAAAPDTIIGHSEGAAGAIYCAAAFCLAGTPPKEVWAFEPPRTSTDGELRAILEAHGVKVHLFIHGHDMVPMVPPDLVDAWQHVADPIRFGKPSSIWPNVHDHLMENILPDLQNLVL